jgi:hypothetical protein
MRIIQLGFRCLEIICSVGLLVLMILIRNVDVTSGWIMRIVVSLSRNHVRIRMLTSLSLALLPFTLSMLSIILRESLLDELLLRLHPICSLPPSSIFQSYPSTSSVHWLLGVKARHGLPCGSISLQHFPRRYSIYQHLVRGCSLFLWLSPFILLSHSARLRNFHPT